MNKFFLVVFCCLGLTIAAQGQSMEQYFRKPAWEEAENNLLWQNRCGNRLTLMFNPTGTTAEFVYKPNAYRRKEFWARNFSNRDNQTVLFSSFSMPDIRSNDATYEYDPFVSRIKISAPSGAKNTLTVVNIPDENAFVLSARSPLLLAIKPHVAFEVRNGLLTEKFTERGEEVVSFIKFTGFEQNRFRVLADGTYVLQLLENDVLLVGGEENTYQSERVMRKFSGLKLADVINYTNEQVQPFMGTAEVFCKNPDFKRVMDFNKKMLYSMVDEGGATFGALTRVYYLIWVRDGSMSTSLMARGGSPSLVSKWAELALNSPSIVRRDDGSEVLEFTQLLGSRWSKSEDDGVFYALLSLFTQYQTTGNDELLNNKGFRIALESIDRFLEKTWDTKRQLIGSDTRGEASLKSSPYYGYDVVNGEMYHNMSTESVDYTTISRNFSLYNQVNTYNLLLMANVLLAKQPALDNGRSARYTQLAEQLKQSITTKFKAGNGNFYSGFEIHEDGSEKWIPFGKECDYWETAWANSLGPYYPAPAIQLSSAYEIKNDWPKYRTYGYCPWNTLSRYLYEYGMSSTEYEKMLNEQIREALTLTKRFPMPGAVTEYQKEIEGWRALPFQIGALYHTMTAQLIQSMPMGIGVRASNFVDSLHNYQYRLSKFNVTQTGQGDVVESYTLNKKVMPYTLQLPQSALRNGLNKLEIIRTKQNEQFRLYSSTAELLNYSVNGNTITYEFNNPVATQLVFEQFDKTASVVLTDSKGNSVPFTQSAIEKKTLLEAPTNGEFILTVKLK